MTPRESYNFGISFAYKWCGCGVAPLDAVVCFVMLLVYGVDDVGGGMA